MMHEEIVETEYEVVSSDVAITASDRAALDVQITTAKAYPRSISKFRETVQELACLDQETAESMFYTLPRGGKKILGPSVRFAEIVQFAWGNIRSETCIVAIDDTHLTAQGTCFDLERNVAARIQVKRRITDKNGKRFNDDMIVTTANAASSIALRGAIFKVIPFSLAKPIYEKAMKTASGGEKPFSVRRSEEFARWKAKDISEEVLLRKLEKRRIEDVDIEDVITLIGLRNAIKEGDTTLEEAFAQEMTGASDLEEQLANLGKSKTVTNGDGGQRKTVSDDADPVPNPDAELDY